MTQWESNESRRDIARSAHRLSNSIKVDHPDFLFIHELVILITRVKRHLALGPELDKVLGEREREGLRLQNGLCLKCDLQVCDEAGARYCEAHEREMEESCKELEQGAKKILEADPEVLKLFEPEGGADAVKDQA